MKKPPQPVLTFALSLAVSVAGIGCEPQTDTASPQNPPEQQQPTASIIETPASSDITPHFENALAQLSKSSPAVSPAPPPYGCSVKYAEGTTGTATAAIGQPAPDFQLLDLNGNTISLGEFKGKTVVLEWYNPDCPFVEYAHGEGGPLRGLADKYTAQDIVWLAINSSAKGKQGAGLEHNRGLAQQYGLSHPVLLDPSGAVGMAYGAKTTPHMFIVRPNGTLGYAGALDNAPFGKAQ